LGAVLQVVPQAPQLVALVFVFTCTSATMGCNAQHSNRLPADTAAVGLGKCEGYKE
jgi:hypothetical protein